MDGSLRPHSVFGPGKQVLQHMDGADPYLIKAVKAVISLVCKRLACMQMSCTTLLGYCISNYLDLKLPACSKTGKPVLGPASNISDNP